MRHVTEDLRRWSLGIEILRVPILKDFFLVFEVC